MYRCAAIGFVIIAAIGCSDDNDSGRQVVINQDASVGDTSTGADASAEVDAAPTSRDASTPDASAELDASPADVAAPDTGPDPCSDVQEPAIAIPNCGPAPLTVEFNGTGIVEGFDSYSRIRWEFGDGTVSYELDPTHTYTLPGDYLAEFSFYGETDGFSSEIAIGDIQVRVLD